jgi:hypothetical protein
MCVYLSPKLHFLHKCARVFQPLPSILHSFTVLVNDKYYKKKLQINNSEFLVFTNKLLFTHCIT